MSPRLSLGGPFGVSVVSIAIVAVVVLTSLPSLFGAVFAGGAGDDEQPTTVLERLAGEHDEAMVVYRERFDGRTFFFQPPPKPKPRPKQIARPKVDRPAPKPAPTGPPPPPANYTGPSPIGIFGQEAWFNPPRAGEGVLRVRVGETKDDLELLEVDPPWSVKVKYQRGEYTVSLFERKDESFFSRAGAGGSTPPGLIESETGASADTATPAAAATPPPPGRGVSKNIEATRRAAEAERAAQVQAERSKKEAAARAVEQKAARGRGEGADVPGEAGTDRDAPIDDEGGLEDEEYDEEDGEYDEEDGEYDEEDGEYDEEDGEYDEEDGEYDEEDGEDPAEEEEPEA
jgi:hypothetical protein